LDGSRSFNACLVCAEGRHNQMTGRLSAEHWPRNLLANKTSQIKRNVEPETHSIISINEATNVRLLEFCVSMQCCWFPTPFVDISSNVYDTIWFRDCTRKLTGPASLVQHIRTKKFMKTKTKEK